MKVWHFGLVFENFVTSCNFIRGKDGHQSNFGGKKSHKDTLLMLINCINKISTIKTNEKEQKTTMNHVYEQKKHKK